jgi:hypothetical protein
VVGRLAAATQRLEPSRLGKVTAVRQLSGAKWDRAQCFDGLRKRQRLQLREGSRDCVDEARGEAGGGDELGGVRLPGCQPEGRGVVQAGGAGGQQELKLLRGVDAVQGETTVQGAVGVDAEAGEAAGGGAADAEDASDRVGGEPWQPAADDTVQSVRMHDMDIGCRCYQCA